MSELPNISPGHVEGCTTQAVFSDPDSLPVLVVVACVEGCPHLTIELDEETT